MKEESFIVTLEPREGETQAQYDKRVLMLRQAIIGEVGYKNVKFADVVEE